MDMIIRRNILGIFLILSPLMAIGQKSKGDSLKISMVVTEFYQWYLPLIKENRLQEFNPSFIENSSGMTTLDFTNYRRELKNHSFSGELMHKRIAEYNPCVSNLNRIPYDTFVTYKDLDDFESINCDFSNSYEWIPGMEPYDSFIILTVELQSKSTAFVQVNFINSNEGDVKSKPSASVFLFKKKGKWLINDVKL